MGPEAVSITAVVCVCRHTQTQGTLSRIWDLWQVEIALKHCIDLFIKFDVITVCYKECFFVIFVIADRITGHTSFFLSVIWDGVCKWWSMGRLSPGCFGDPQCDVTKAKIFNFVNRARRKTHWVLRPSNVRFLWWGEQCTFSWRCIHQKSSRVAIIDNISCSIVVEFFVWYWAYCCISNGNRCTVLRDASIHLVVQWVCGNITTCSVVRDGREGICCL